MDENSCSSHCSCSEDGSCSCSDAEPVVEIRERISASMHRPPSEEIPPPPLEFDTTLYQSQQAAKVAAQIHADQEASPTESEDMRYASPEADQYCVPYNRYSQQMVANYGMDSATDSAIDMPGDGSVSTINEIPPAHNQTSMYLKRRMNGSADPPGDDPVAMEQQMMQSRFSRPVKHTDHALPPIIYEQLRPSMQTAPHSQHSLSSSGSSPSKLHDIQQRTPSHSLRSDIHSRFSSNTSRPSDQDPAAVTV